MTDDTVSAGIQDDEESAHPLLDWRIVEGRGSETWVSWLAPEMHWLLDEHRIKGDPVLPGTGYLELVRAAFEEYTRKRVGDGVALELSNVALLSPLAIANDDDREVRTVFKKRGDTIHFRVMSRPDQNAKQWTEHCGGMAAWVDCDEVPVRDLAAIRKACGDVKPVAEGELVPKSDFLVFGSRWHSTWKSIDKVCFGEKQQLTEMALGDELAEDLEQFRLHPALLDVALFVYSKDGQEGGKPHLPFSYGKIVLRGPLSQRLGSHIEHLSESRFHVSLLDPDGRELVEIVDYELREVDESKMGQAQAQAQAAASGGVPEGKALEIQVGTPGLLETLKFHPRDRREPGPGEVEIEIKATGLNFKDVLFALGVLPVPGGGAPKLGMECAGVLTAVGEGVEGLAVGDEVFAMAIHSFASHVTTPAIAVGKKPKHLSYADAAAIPNAYYTAYYALVTLGGMKAGERVLVHTAAGGVGLAAVKICQAMGAEIYATAGSDEKREYLRNLGIECVMNSRTLDWAEELKEATDGKGVHLVLNSLAGEYITKGLEALTVHGRFLELGVRDIYANTPLGLAPFAKALSFFAVMVSEDVPGFRDIWDELFAKFDDKTFEPLPTKTFSIGEVDKAFEFMSRAKHIGKVAVDVDGPFPLP